jgi:hypothetical protein
MKISKYLAVSLTAGAGALAIAVAPVAAAAPDGSTCSDSGTASVCQTDGNAQIVVTPPPIDYGVQDPFLYGGGLLFHHGGR